MKRIKFRMNMESWKGKKFFISGEMRQYEDLCKLESSQVWAYYVNNVLILRRHIEFNILDTLKKVVTIIGISSLKINDDWFVI